MLVSEAAPPETLAFSRCILGANSENLTGTLWRRRSGTYPPGLGHPSGSTRREGCTVMKRLRIGVIDIVSRGPTRALYARIMNASLASIMPQVIGVWCQQEGHEVTFVCYTGFEDLL